MYLISNESLEDIILHNHNCAFWVILIILENLGHVFRVNRVHVLSPKHFSSLINMHQL